MSSILKYPKFYRTWSCYFSLILESPHCNQWKNWYDCISYLPSSSPVQFFWFLFQLSSVFCLPFCLLCSCAPLLLVAIIWWFRLQHWSQQTDIWECDTGAVLSRALWHLLVLTFSFDASEMDVEWLKLFELFITLEGLWGNFRYMFTCFNQLELLFMKQNKGSIC